ncbi:hypothetical protein CY34DRAFT_724534 [Suillus luteus UH-Slu-Lm8-n1]|uniref:Uncharacterized protein n=1 Tax=Suillus luteus UH-Slu-Lm8-n1 TaxID=930992 RepID=A0A0C9ZZW8_9AGAM|nr:hypothetical protein CY34DRAFT_724534 [Suillus luteus UH-Slu-Lm8-n1]
MGCLILSNEPRRSLWTETVARRANACNTNDDAAHRVVLVETDNDNDVNDDAGDRGIVGSTWPFLEEQLNEDCDTELVLCFFLPYSTTHHVVNTNGASIR